MNLDDNKDEDQEPSTDPELDEVTDMPEEGNAPSDDAKSSTATGEESSEDSDLLSVVRDVVGGEQAESGDEAASPAESDEENKDEENDDTSKEQDDEDYTDVPFHKHPRFQQLLRKSKANEHDAQQYQKVQSFIDQHGLEAEEAANLLTIGGLMKTDPAEAWARMKPTIQNLLMAAGEVLPDDLKDRVSKGEITQDAALEVSRLRAKQKSQQATQSFEQQRQEQQRQQESRQAVISAVDGWEKDRRAKDPNFDAKYERLQDEVYKLQRKEGVPTSPDKAKDQLNRAYKSIASAKSGDGKTQQRQRSQQTNSGGQVAGNQRPADQSTLDIIRANRRAS